MAMVKAKLPTNQTTVMFQVWFLLDLRFQINLISEVSDATMDSDHIDQCPSTSSRPTTSTQPSLCQRAKAGFLFPYQK